MLLSKRTIALENFREELEKMGIYSLKTKELKKLVKRTDYVHWVRIDLKKLIEHPELKQNIEKYREFEYFQEQKLALRNHSESNLLLQRINQKLTTTIGFESLLFLSILTPEECLTMLERCGKQRELKKIAFKQVFSKKEGDAQAKRSYREWALEMENAKKELDRFLSEKVEAATESYQYRTNTK